MLNFNPETVDDPRRNFRAIERHVDDDYYVWRLCPGDFGADSLNPGALIDGAGAAGVNRFGAIRLHDGATQSVACSRRRPTLWLSGMFKIDVDYTCGVGSTNNFNITPSLHAVTKSGNIQTPTVFYSAAITWPGPAVGFDVQQWSVYTTAALTGAHHLIGIAFLRAGAADANAGRLDILSVTLTFIPSLREAHVP